MRYLYILITLLMTSGLYAQQVNIEDLQNIKKKKPLQISGSLSLSGTHFSAGEMQARQPFTYQLVGSVNLSFYELINIPLSVNLNNYGANFSYPSLPNRLSLHPSYKWAKAHIGDVSMSLSPYTMNGHQFTGLGIELSPSKFQIMAFGGRLLRAVDYKTTIPNLMPNYERWGYGGKLRYNAKNFFVGGTVFFAKDKLMADPIQLDSLGIYPKQNIALSLEGGLNLLKNLDLSFEYGLSFLQRDIRLGRVKPSIYRAIKLGLNYSISKNTIGLAYERISPDYATLGAYYFNNDYENLTLNYARPFLRDKLQVALSGGVQRDDLNNQKAERNLRLVGSANLNYTPSERVNLSLSASTFQGHRNIKSNFDYINERSPYDNLDTLNFTQISNSIDFNLNWTTRQSEVRTDQFNLNLSYQEAGDRQGGYIMPGNLTRFFNIGSSYGLDFIPINLNINVGLNASNNYATLVNMLTIGPVASISWRAMQNKLSTSLSLSANRTYQEGLSLVDIFNVRYAASYRFLKRHNVQLSIAYQKRDLKDNRRMPDSFSTTSTLSYSMNF